MLEERDPDLNEEEYIIMDEIRNDHWRDVAEKGDDKKNISALRWEVYIKYKEGFIKRDFRCLFHIRNRGTLFVLV